MPLATHGQTVTSAELQAANQQLVAIASAFSSRIVGQEGLRTSLLVGLLTGGHILLESVPGLAKTMAAHTLATSVTAAFNRIQCTPDLLPSDITGTQIFDSSTNTFKTQLGPVHANFVLLDEINRSSAKTQSAMLEAMQEKQTSIGGTVYPLPDPFLVIATQNPIEQEGTYLLPEAQLDRFLLKEILEYPSAEDELVILDRLDAGVFREGGIQTGVVSLDEVLSLQATTRKVYADEAIRRYIVSIVDATRNPGGVIPDSLGELIDVGASPRGSIAFLQAARAIALLSGRDSVIPEDIKMIAHRVLRHRIILGFEADADDITTDTVIDAIIAAVPAP